jgi:hypothetical protein
VRNRIDFAPPDTESEGTSRVATSPTSAKVVVRVRRMDAEIYDTPRGTTPRTHMPPAHTQTDEIIWD